MRTWMTSLQALLDKPNLIKSQKRIKYLYLCDEVLGSSFAHEANRIRRVQNFWWKIPVFPFWKYMNFSGLNGRDPMVTGWF